MKHIFIDTNVILDIFNPFRPTHDISKTLYKYLLSNSFVLYTSCDIITTLYYIESKRSKAQALKNIQNINKTLKVIEFSNKEVEQTCQLMLDDKDYTDLEDSIQYILAKKLKCDLIISNDKNFTSKDVKLLTSQQFCKEFKII